MHPAWQLATRIIAQLCPVRALRSLARPSPDPWERHRVRQLRSRRDRPIPAQHYDFVRNFTPPSIASAALTSRYTRIALERYGRVLDTRAVNKAVTGTRQFGGKGRQFIRTIHPQVRSRSCAQSQTIERFLIILDGPTLLSPIGSVLAPSQGNIEGNKIHARRVIAKASPAKTASEVGQ